MKNGNRLAIRTVAVAFVCQVLAVACDGLLFAQTNPATAKGEAPPRYYVWELLVVLVLFGLCLYSVCRTSRRS